MAEPLIDVQDLRVHFPLRTGRFGGQRATVRAVDGVSFRIHSGQTLGLVGESGCGKTTTGRVVLRLQQPTSGFVRFRGQDLSRLDRRGMRRMSREVSAVFQDPYDSLDPRMTVARIIAEPLIAHGLSADRRGRVQELLDAVGLDGDMAERYPGELSGGQRQRIGIARALSTQPSLLVCDEPVSALDVSVQAQVVNLFRQLKSELGLAYLFIAHDLSVVRYLSDEIIVMYAGKVVEAGPSDVLVQEPIHPYTRALLAAVPAVDPSGERQQTEGPVAGEAPSATSPPAGCRFHPRCPFATDMCSREEPVLEEALPGRIVACHHWQEVHSAAPVA